MQPEGEGGSILHIMDYTGRLPASSPGFSLKKWVGSPIFLKEKPSGRGWKAYLFESSGIYRKGQGFHKLKHMKEVTGVVYGCKKSKPMVLYIRYLKVM